MYKAMVVGMLAFGASCTYRMGRGLPMDPSLALGEIQAATSIQGAEEALSQALVRELARRSGRGAPQVVNLELLHLEDAPSASGSRQSRLRLAIALSSDGDHRVVVAGTRVYVGASTAAENATRRQEALSALAEELIEEGLPQLFIPTRKD